MVDPKKKQPVAASRDNDVRSESIENAHASGDGALEKSDDRLEELQDEEEPKDPPY